MAAAGELGAGSAVHIEPAAAIGMVRRQTAATKTESNLAHGRLTQR
jgi:hypothetical protein